MYFDENLVLDLRLNTLNDYVDKFIIAEATRDHAGNKKKLNFDYKNFSKFKDKIIYLVIEDLPIEVKSKKKNWMPSFRYGKNCDSIQTILWWLLPHHGKLLSERNSRSVEKWGTKRRFISSRRW